MIGAVDSWARLDPSRVALIDDSGYVWTYLELSTLARRANAWLARRGLAPGDRLATLAYGGAEQVALFFACQRSGVALVPLNWRLSAAELGAVVEDCSPRLVLFDEEFREAAEALGPRAEPLSCFAGLPPLSWPGAEPPEEAVPLILYTSGTTGRPKGAMLSTRMLRANAEQTAEGWGLDSGDSTVTAAPLFHTGGWNVLTLPLLLIGGHVTLLKRFDAARVAALAQAGRASVLFGVPTMLEALLLAGLSRGPRFVISGGAPCPKRVVDAYLDLGVSFRQGFGMTEAGPNCFRFPEGEERRKAGTVGLPMPGTEMRLTDEGGREASEGELWIGGPHLFSGYLGRPDETAATLAGGWVRTGDLARRDQDGFYRILGRKKEMYITGGENVYPGEVEAVLLAHPGVREAAVIGVPDERWGESSVAFIVPRAERPLTPQELRAFLDGRLARYKRPRELRFLDELPRNAMGKVLRPALRDLLRPGVC